MARADVTLTPEQASAVAGVLTLSPEEFEAKWGGDSDRAGRPRTGGLRPSPGREAARARREVAELRQEVEALTARVEALEGG